LNLNKILTLVIGFTVLAGLALHQGNRDGVLKVDKSVLTGTALMRPANTEAADSGDGQKGDAPDDSQCPSIAAMPAEESEECPPVAENEQMESAPSRVADTSQG
jgi:hypothetical protein